MQFTPTDIPEVLRIQPDLHADDRGFFAEIFRKSLFEQAGIELSFVQDNLSSSSKGALRGLHYQIDRPQGKLVQVLQGEIFDVAVDLRRSSPTFGRWVAVELSSRDLQMVWIPPTFAHGFYVLSERALVMYKATDYYDPDSERTLAWNDPTLAIEWPIPEGTEPILSPKDARGAPLNQLRVFD